MVVTASFDNLWKSVYIPDVLWCPPLFPESVHITSIEGYSDEGYSDPFGTDWLGMGWWSGFGRDFSPGLWSQSCCHSTAECCSPALPESKMPQFSEDVPFPPSFPFISIRTDFFHFKIEYLPSLPAFLSPSLSSSHFSFFFFLTHMSLEFTSYLKGHLDETRH